MPSSNSPKKYTALLLHPVKTRDQLILDHHSSWDGINPSTHSSSTTTQGIIQSPVWPEKEKELPDEGWQSPRWCLAGASHLEMGEETFRLC